MVRSKALVLFLLVSIHLHFMIVTALWCPSTCVEYRPSPLQQSVRCHCPFYENGLAAPCWISHGGRTTFKVNWCIHAVPTGFHKDTKTINIKHLSASTLLLRSFANISSLEHLTITRSNVCSIQPGAFLGLPSLRNLALIDNSLSSLESDTFIGLEQVTELQLFKNVISSISPYAFRGLPRLVTLGLSENRLISVPVKALLQPQALRTAKLEKNRMTTINTNIIDLMENTELQVHLENNELRCDNNLTWFICNLPQLHQIASPNVLKCASPPDLRDTVLTTMRKDVCKNNTESTKEEIGTTTNDGISPTASLHNSTNDKEIQYKTEMPDSQHTTDVDHVIFLEGYPIINKDKNIIYTLTMIGAVVVSLLLVLSFVGVLFICKRYFGPCLTSQHGMNGEETEVSQDIVPYAVVYAGSAEQQTSDENSAPDSQPASAQGQSSGDNETFQPYAVAYGEDQDPSSEIRPYAEAYSEDQEPEPEIKPYAVAYDENPGQTDICRIPLYAEGYPDTPQEVGGHADADSTQMGDDSNDQATTIEYADPEPNDQSLSTDETTNPKCVYDEGENGNLATQDGKDAYGMKEEVRFARLSGILYRSGSQHAGKEEHDVSDLLYSPDQGEVVSKDSSSHLLYNPAQGEAKDSTCHLLYKPA
uniref:LRRCT domain-containing protein n=1 Tax=Branchiostoma floridae TaxID=7739 RepID=C3YQN3_BRAFL|eukprot:XP_002601377.1 hypothetical protein BRAFLDRAFT_82681 [Branchiostoma floridae]